MVTLRDESVVLQVEGSQLFRHGWQCDTRQQHIQDDHVFQLDRSRWEPRWSQICVSLLNPLQSTNRNLYSSHSVFLYKGAPDVGEAEGSSLNKRYRTKRRGTSCGGDGFPGTILPSIRDLPTLIARKSWIELIQTPYHPQSHHHYLRHHSIFH